MVHNGPTVAMVQTYNVERIVSGPKGQGRSRMYEVKWEGYPPSENTWEPMSNLKDVVYMIDAYEKKSGAVETRVVLPGASLAAHGAAAVK